MDPFSRTTPSSHICLWWDTSMSFIWRIMYSIVQHCMCSNVAAMNEMFLSLSLLEQNWRNTVGRGPFPIHSQSSRSPFGRQFSVWCTEEGISETSAARSFVSERKSNSCYFGNGFPQWVLPAHRSDLFGALDILCSAVLFSIAIFDRLRDISTSLHVEEQTKEEQKSCHETIFSSQSFPTCNNSCWTPCTLCKWSTFTPSLTCRFYATWKFSTAQTSSISILRLSSELPPQVVISLTSGVCSPAFRVIHRVPQRTNIRTNEHMSERTNERT